MTLPSGGAVPRRPVPLRTVCPYSSSQLRRASSARGHSTMSTSTVRGCTNVSRCGVEPLMIWVLRGILSRSTIPGLFGFIGIRDPRALVRHHPGSTAPLPSGYGPAARGDGGDPGFPPFGAPPFSSEPLATSFRGSFCCALMGGTPATGLHGPILMTAFEGAGIEYNQVGRRLCGRGLGPASGNIPPVPPGRGGRRK